MPVPILSLIPSCCSLLSVDWKRGGREQPATETRCVVARTIFPPPGVTTELILIQDSCGDRNLIPSKIKARVPSKRLNGRASTAVFPNGSLSSGREREAWKLEQKREARASSESRLLRVHGSCNRRNQNQPASPSGVLKGSTQYASIFRLPLPCAKKHCIRLLVHSPGAGFR